MNEPDPPRRIVIERLEIVASRDAGMSPSALNAFGRAVAEALGRELAAGPTPQQARTGQIELSLPRGVTSPTAIASAIERRVQAIGGRGGAPVARRER